MKKSESPVGVGVISALTVLLVLVMAVFAALTFASAKADLALSRRNAEMVTRYYAEGLPAVTAPGEDIEANSHLPVLGG